MKRNHPPESQVVSACLKWLWHHGVFCYRQNTGAYKPEGSKRYIRYGTRGGADIVGITKAGRAIFVEAKSAKGEQSPPQVAFQRNVELHNGIYILAYGIEQLEERKHEILATHYPPGYADGYTPQVHFVSEMTLPEFGA